MKLVDADLIADCLRDEIAKNEDDKSTAGMAAKRVLKRFIGLMEEFPAAQPQRMPGRWERHFSRPNVYADLYWHCSVCGYENDNSYAHINHHYCPNCGARMDGGEQNG